MIDLLVIGAGLTGLYGALVAAKAGLRVRVVAKGLGALHWSAGTIDLLGYDPANNREIQHPLSTLNTLSPQHPYARMGEEAIQAALKRFILLAQAQGLNYAGAASGHENMWLPSPVGAGRPAFLAPAAQRTGSLGRAQPMLIVGFDGLRDYFPHLIADNLSQLGHTARSALLPLALISVRRDNNPMQIAQQMDTDGPAETLTTALRKLVIPGERIGLPALLGLRRHRKVWRQMQTELETPVFEIPTLPPSVPGMRLHMALVQTLRQQGVRVEIGMNACNFDATQDTIEWVETETGSRPLRHRARHFLLATGGLLGGGFDSSHRGNVWETLFDLPLTIPEDRAHWFHPHFLHAGGQPIFQGGIAVTEHFQPVGVDGSPVFCNLWAAGNGLAYTDPIRERSLEGLAIVTGDAAVHAIIQQHTQSG